MQHVCCSQRDFSHSSSPSPSTAAVPKRTPSALRAFNILKKAGVYTGMEIWRQYGKHFAEINDIASFRLGLTRVQQPVRSEWNIQDGGKLLSKIVSFLPAIAHKSETSTATKFKMAWPIFRRKCFLLFLALYDLCSGTKVATCDVNTITR